MYSFLDTPKVEPRIYVACLAAYNNGKLHGKWIDATQDADSIQDEINAMLKASPEPNAEEYAIHDFEGFGSLRLSEYESIETIAKLAEAIDEHGELFAEYYNQSSYTDVETALEDFEDKYRGAYDSKRAYAEYWLEETGNLATIPEHLQGYFDYDYYARDLFMDLTAIEYDGQVHVFSD